MSAASFLSKLLLAVSILALISSFLVFPTIMTNPNSDLSLYTIKDVWESRNFELPIITKMAVFFADSVILRYIFFAVLIVIGVFAEFSSANKKIPGLVHTFNLIIGMLTGTIFLLSLVVPFMPLG
ncbi:MAG: hypothetical protein KAW12_30980 [Candidatus Aminicenantes bacterium]|nr:hypothetical protein [Candidatus Aminicenantes bacterium]